MEAFSDGESQIKKIDLKKQKVETFFEGRNWKNLVMVRMISMVVHSSGIFFTSGQEDIGNISRGELQARMILVILLVYLMQMKITFM